jgi:hypothetical protein
MGFLRHQPPEPAMTRPPLDAWPLLPRPAAAGITRPEDEPAEAAISALGGLAALLLLLRWLLPGTGLAQEVAGLVALWASLAGFALTIAILALLVGTAVVTPILPLPEPIKEAGLAAFDHALHLALVLTAAGVLGIIVLNGQVPPITIWFSLQAILLWACHRTRLWLAGRSPA